MATEFVLQARNLSKSFPGVKALAAVSLDVAPGEVHALVGENGAGKSTLMRLLAGLHRPDAGQVLFQGRAVVLRNPHAALRLGISMIHQELMPFPDLTVAENIFIGREPASRLAGWIDQHRLHADTERLLERLGVALPPGRPMRQLSVAEMQIVEIAKAMAGQAAVIIMDEPTSAISEREVEALFGIIRDLKVCGVAVIYVSHKLEEIFRIADTVTVLRDGERVATRPAAGLDAATLIGLMVGRELSAAVPTCRAPKGEVALEVRGLGRVGRFRDVSFALRRGEILGLAGLMGAGRTEVVSAIYGLPPADAGEISVGGRSARVRSPRDAIARGIAMVSEDRKRFGLVLPMSVQHNVTLASLKRCCRGPWIDRHAEARTADERIASFAIKARHRDERVENLSGGNQQKVVLAKALLAEPDIVLLDEPTRGIDIGAKAEIHGLIAALAGQGKAILMVSSDLAEVLSLSDRVLVMRQGAVTAELDAHETTPEEVMKFAVPI